MGQITYLGDVALCELIVGVVCESALLRKLDNMEAAENGKQVQGSARTGSPALSSCAASISKGLVSLPTFGGGKTTSFAFSA